jgi:lipopolysaccharide transport system ATP-binding protein
VFRIDRPLRVEFEYDPKDASDAVVTLVLRNTQGVWVHHSTDEFSDELIDRRAGRRTCEVPAYALAADEYFVTAALGARYGELYEKLGDVARFTVEFTGTMSDRTPAAAWKGVCGPGLLRWA